MSYSWDNYGITGVVKKSRLEIVALIDQGSGYDWDEMQFYYSPDTRRFYWFEDSGCSCNGFGDGVTSLDDLSNGSREDALRAARKYAASTTGLDREYEQAVLAIKEVKVDR